MLTGLTFSIILGVLYWMVQNIYNIAKLGLQLVPPPRPGSLGGTNYIPCESNVISITYLHDPNASCFRAARHLMCYLNSNSHFGIKYQNPNPKNMRLEAYADASYDGEDIDQARSISGQLVYFGGGPIDWASSLQPVIALSSAEAEQNAAFLCLESISKK